MDVGTPDERSVITYVSSLYEALPTMKINPNQNEKEKVFNLQLKNILRES